MSDKLKTKVEIIDEIISYYSEDPTRRGIDGGCIYFSENLSDSGENKMCAVGYCLKDPKEIQELTGGEEWSSLTNYIYNKETMVIPHLLLKKEYRHDDDDFWTDLQLFHDNNYFWDEEGLTKQGSDFRFTLKKRYG